MNDHISRESSFEHWPLDKEGNRAQKDGEPTVKNIRFGRVDISALKELEDHLRREPLESLLQTIKDCRDSSIQEMMVRSAVNLGDMRRIGTKEFDRAVKTVSGLSYLMYLSARAKQDEFSPTIALKVYSDATALGREGLLQKVLFSATGFTDESASGNAPGVG